MLKSGSGGVVAGLLCVAALWQPVRAQEATVVPATSADVAPPLAAPVPMPYEPEPTVAPAVTPAAAAGPAAITPAIAPAVSSAPASKPEVADDPRFPRYASLKPAVDFWTRVFSQYSELQSAIHSAEFPGKVFEVLDFRDDAVRLPVPALARLRSSSEEASKDRYEKLLKQVHELRNTPGELNSDQRRVYQMFSDVQGDDRFKRAIGTLRAQRGLKERTALALEISGRYLPEMESTFARYGLPARLTRLPLVESSFNVEAYSKVGAAGLWQFMPSSAKIYMRLNEVVDDRRDPWTSTDAAARHLRDDYAALKSWPLAITAYNHGRGGIARGLSATGGTALPDLIARYDAKSFGFASKNFYAEFLAASDVERNWRTHFNAIERKTPLRFDTVETRHYVPYDTLRRLCNADDELFRKLNPAYRPEVIEGKLYVPPGHLIRVPAGAANSFNLAYAKLGNSERFDAQKVYYLQYKIAKGDSLGKIASRHGVSQVSLRNANGFKEGVKLRLGQVIKVPPREERRLAPVTVAVGESTPGLTREQADNAAVERNATPKLVKAPKSKNKLKVARVHKVQSGQTLGSIAKRYKVSVTDLRAANDLGSSSQIKVGQKLRIPVS